MKKLRVRLFRVAFSLVAACVLALGVLWWRGADDLPAPDADLALAPREVSAEVNGFELLWSLRVGPLSGPPSPSTASLLNGIRPEKMEAVRQWLREQAPTLDTLDRCLSRPELQASPAVRGAQSQISTTRLFDRLAGLLGSSALVASTEQDWTRALARASNLLELGRRLRQARGSSSLYWHGDLMLERGVLVARILLAQPGPRAPELRAFLEQTRGCAGWHEAFASTVQVDYARFKDALESPFSDVRQDDVSLIQRLCARVIGRRPFLLQERSKRVLADACRMLLRGAQSLPPDWKTAEGVDPGARGPLDLVCRPNGIGRVLTGAAIRFLEDCAEHSRLNEARIGLLRAAVALRCQELEQGTLPATLAELTPGLLDTVPVDPFDGKPLRYDAARRTLHSIGRDLKDAGGSSSESPAGAILDAFEPTWLLDPAR